MSSLLLLEWESKKQVKYHMKLRVYAMVTVGKELSVNHEPGLRQKTTARDCVDLLSL